VVSTHLPAVRPVAGSVWLADDIAGTVNCCCQATQHNSTEDRLRRSRSMQVESWTARLEQISRIVAEIESWRTLSASQSGVPIAAPIAGAAPVPSFCCRSN